ncbi:SpoVR family protein [Haloparvum sp. AD34]
MTRNKRRERKRIARELEPVVSDARLLAAKLGLDGHPVNYWIVDYDEMNQLIAYDGFPERYPHWRWGMKYERQRKQDRYGAGKAFEIVINDDPAHAYLQESNSLADQKAVITHVEAHADFFKNNRWFRPLGESVNAVDMLERHADRIESYMRDPEIDREAVERFIDSVLTLTDAIDQHQPVDQVLGDEGAPEDLDEPFEALDLSEEVREEVFESTVNDAADEADGDGEAAAGATDAATEGARDVLAYLREHGKQYDVDAERAVEMEDWQTDVIEMLRREAYYFAPQQMTKVLNEGWASYWESIMMGEEAFADADEFLTYAEHQARVLGSEGFNPYKLGKELWEHVENVTNRREVVEQLLRVGGISPHTFHDEVDVDAVLDQLDPTPPLDAISADSLDRLADLDPAKVDHEALDRARSGEFDVREQPWRVLTYKGLAERHFSLTKPRNRGFLGRIDHAELEQIDRYLFDDAVYDSVADALADVDYAAGWDRLYEVRESHNDVTFLDEFLTPEFVRANDYFTYEYSHAAGEYRVSGTDPDSVKRKLLLQFTNFGKPTVVVADGNYENRNELLLHHEYNGVQLDVSQATETLKRVFELWGRPVNLKTIVKTADEEDDRGRLGNEPNRSEEGKLLRYDGDSVEMADLEWHEVEDVVAEGVDYDTKPDEWL